MSTLLDPAGLAEWFRRRAARAPERPALTFENRTWSYGEMQVQIERLAAVLAAAGIKAGERVAYLGANHPTMLFSLFACARIGAIQVPLNFRLSAPELAAIVQDCGATGVMADTQYAPVLESVRDSLPCTRWWCTDADRPGWDALLPAMARPLPESLPVSGADDDVVALIYTSGTTGRPKGVMLSNRNFWTNNLNLALANDMTSQDVTLACAPLFHVGGLCVVLLPTLMCGGHLILQGGFEPLAYLEAIQRHKVTLSFAVPAMLLFASQHTQFGAIDLSSLRLIAVGGAPVPEPLLLAYQARGIPLSQGYGMTEATAGVTFLDARRAASKLGSCGKPLMLTEVKIVDAEGNTLVEPHARGEICMRGGNITRGYWNRSDETAKALDAEGWLHSGDGAYVDEEGFYTICDRIKDMIISGGENIYPAEIESLLYEHPAIAEVAVIGAPDERWGERVLVIAALKPGAALSFEQLIQFVEPRLARYKLPRELHVLDAMPRNANGKIVKTELRQRFAQRA